MKLRDYQDRISDEAAMRLRDYGLCYLAMECRTGKTLTALATAQKYGASSVLFITKLKAIASIKGDYKAMQPGFSIEIINYESCHKCKGGYDIIVLDEAHSLGAYPKPNARIDRVKEICGGLPVLLLSGTPSPESYSQLYHQFWISDHSPFADYPTFYKWARAGYVDVREKHINGYRINDYSHADREKIDRDTAHLFLTYSQNEAGFTSEIEDFEVKCLMSATTRNLIRQMKRHKLCVFDGLDILGDTPAKLMSKLHQLSSGTVIAENGSHLTIDRSKANFIAQLFDGKKIAIFYVYQSEFDLLTSTFTNWTDNPEEFQAASDKVFISQVRRAREGIRLDSAEAIVFYSLEFSYLSYEQGRNRIVSKERHSPAKVYFITSDCGIDADILEAVKGKRILPPRTIGRNMAQSNTPESAIQRQIITVLKEAGYMVVKIGLCSLPGFPDLMALKDGQTLFIEVKRPGCRPRPLQQYRLGELQRKGFRAIVADSVDAVKRELNQLSQCLQRARARESSRRKNELSELSERLQRARPVDF